MTDSEVKIIFLILLGIVALFIYLCNDSHEKNK